MRAQPIQCVPLLAMLAACARDPPAPEISRESANPRVARALPRPGQNVPSLDAGVTPTGCTVQSARRLETVSDDETLASTRIAAAGSEALVTWWLDYSGGQDGVPLMHVVWLDAAAPGRGTPQSLPVSAAGCAPVLLGEPVAFEGQPQLFAYGLGSPPFANTGHQFTLVTRQGRSRSVELRHRPAGLLAASQGANILALSFGDRSRTIDRCEYDGSDEHWTLGWETRAFSFTRSAMTSHVVAAAPDAGASALLSGEVAAVDDRHAIVVTRAGDALTVFRLGPTAQVIGPEQVVSRGDLGAPTVVFRAGMAHLVWAQRQRSAGDAAPGPFALYYTVWDPDAGPPPAPRILQTGSASAFAPSIAVEGDQLVLAWMEGDQARTGSIRIGSTRGELEHVIDNAVTLHTGSTNARDPEIALTSQAGWIVWQEFTAHHPRGEVHVGLLHCP